jgi:hypothetical protein
VSSAARDSAAFGGYADNYEVISEPKHEMLLAPLAYAMLGLGLIAIAQVIATRRSTAIPAAVLL